MRYPQKKVRQEGKKNPLLRTLVNYGMGVLKASSGELQHATAERCQSRVSEPVITVPPGTFSHSVQLERARDARLRS
jgi:hypothetical protein